MFVTGTSTAMPVENRSMCSRATVAWYSSAGGPPVALEMSTVWAVVRRRDIAGFKIDSDTVGFVERPKPVTSSRDGPAIAAGVTTASASAMSARARVRVVFRTGHRALLWSVDTGCGSRSPRVTPPTPLSGPSALLLPSWLWFWIGAARDANRGALVDRGAVLSHQFGADGGLRSQRSPLAASAE